jgi:hypothetical protein
VSPPSVIVAACAGDSSEEAGTSSEEDESSGGEDGVMPPRGLHNLLQPELLGPSGASEWGELQLADNAAGAGQGESTVTVPWLVVIYYVSVLSICLWAQVELRHSYVSSEAGMPYMILTSTLRCQVESHVVVSSLSLRWCSGQG